MLASKKVCINGFGMAHVPFFIVIVGVAGLSYTGTYIAGIVSMPPCAVASVPVYSDLAVASMPVYSEFPW